MCPTVPITKTTWWISPGEVRRHPFTRWVNSNMHAWHSLKRNELNVFRNWAGIILHHPALSTKPQTVVKIRKFTACLYWVTLNFFSVWGCLCKSVKLFSVLSPSKFVMLGRRFEFSCWIHWHGLRIITARKRSLGKGNIFTSVCHSVQGGWADPLLHPSTTGYGQ